MRRAGTRWVWPARRRLIAGAGDVLQVDPEAGGGHHEHRRCQQRTHQPVGGQRGGQRDAVEDRHRQHEGRRSTSGSSRIAGRCPNFGDGAPMVRGPSASSGEAAMTHSSMTTYSPSAKNRWRTGCRSAVWPWASTTESTNAEIADEPAHRLMTKPSDTTSPRAPRRCRALSVR